MLDVNNPKMYSKELTERKKTISGKLGNLMKRIALNEMDRLDIEVEEFSFTLDISSSGNHISFRVHSKEKNDFIENESYYALRWIREPNPQWFDEAVYVIDKMESLFIKYSKLNK